MATIEKEASSVPTIENDPILHDWVEIDGVDYRINHDPKYVRALVDATAKLISIQDSEQIS
jgi:hypothetical protein